MDDKNLNGLPYYIKNQIFIHDRGLDSLFSSFLFLKLSDNLICYLIFTY